MGQNLNKENKLSPRVKGALIGITIFLIGCIIAFMRYQILNQNEIQESQAVLELIEQNIEQTIQDSYSVALTLALTVNQDGEVENFERIAKNLLDNHDNVDVLELVPGGVIEYVYPLEGNESVVGYDILSDPRVNEEVRRAADQGTIYFAGPIDLKQGGRAVIGRLPITINEEFWGFSAVLIYVETLIEKSGISNFPKEGYYFQLAKLNLDSGEEEYFLPVRDVKLSNFAAVNFPEGDWRLYATRTGTNESKTSLIIILALSAFGGILFGFLSTKVFIKPEELQVLLHEKSEELLYSREKFKKNSELLQSVLESPKLLVMFSLDTNYNYLAFTVSHKKIMKKMWNQEIEIGKNMLDFIPDEEVKKFLKSDFDKALEGNYFDYIRSYSNENVSKQHWDNMFSPIYSETGEIIGLTVFVTNITQRVEAEEEIKLEKQLSDSIINSLPGVFYLYNKEGQFYRWNKNFETVTGYTNEEMKSVHPIDFFDHDEKELLTEKIENVFISGEDSVEANFLLKDGSKIPYYFTGAALNYKGEECLVGVGIDISEKKKVEQKHEEVLQQLQNHLSNSPLGVIEYDSDLNIISWSKRCEELFGWSEREMLGKNAFDIIYEQDKTKTKVVAHELSTGNIDSNISNNRNHTKSGEIVDCIWYNSVVKDASGEIATVMSLVEDVTEKKKSAEIIESSLHEKTTLLSEIHHRVKNNLAIVSGLLELQKNEVNDEKVTIAFEQSINRIISIAMVHELMYKSPDLSSVSVSTYLEGLIPAISKTMEDKSKQIKFNIDIEDHKLNISEAIPIGLLFNELITNSYKYAFKEQKIGVITIKLSVSGDDDIKVVYEDNGIGFDSGIDFEKPKNLGLNLIHAQIQQIDAEYKVDTDSKFKLEFNFKAKPIRQFETMKP